MKYQKYMSRTFLFLMTVILLFVLSACGKSNDTPDTETQKNLANNHSELAITSEEAVSESEIVRNEEKPIVNSIQTGWITEQVLDGSDGEIHYSYYLPESYDGEKPCPMVVVMPGYDMMWFGEKSSGASLSWRGILAWVELDEDMIVVSAQLTDWHEKSARQSVELTEYFIENFSVDKNRVYAAGYSAGGETMSQAVSMRPDLYAAYLHGASQWDGTYDSIAESGMAVYIFIAENDEYYGSQKARDAYAGLYEAYQSVGWTEGQIDGILQLEIPDDEYFNSRGIYNYHGGGNILFDDESILKWIILHRK